jgi:hypothetical protein
MFIRYPDLPELPWDLQQNEDIRQWHKELQEWWSAVKDELEQRDKLAIYGAANATPWQLTSITPAYVFAPTSATDTYTADRLATLIQDLQTKGVVS